MEIEDPTPSTPTNSRFKPNRICIITVVVTFTVGLILFHHIHIHRGHSTPNQNSPVLHTGGGRVDVLLDERNPYNITITSDMDVVQSLDAQGTRVEISIRGLLENRTSGPVRITRSDGERYDVQLSYNASPRSRPIGLTPLSDIKPNILNIFFIETRCGTAKQLKKHSPNSGVVLNARQICAVESTARLNPSRPVYLLHTCPLDQDFFDRSPKFVQEFLLAYSNVHVVFLDMAEFFLRTNVEQLYFGGRFEESVHPVEHVSDVVRLLTLWRYGGTYMDIDVVSIRPLDPLGSNYAGWQDDQTIASGVLNFAPSGFGHQVLSECLDYLRFNFEPTSWSSNGPILVTNTLMRLCGVGKKQAKGCKEFTAYPVAVFYPLYYTEWQDFFDTRPVVAKRTLNRLNDTFVVHIWNKMSSQGLVEVGSVQAYGQLADRYCPKAYWNCGPTF